ncbi:alpha-tubulin N-acetyltransferase 1-like [Maniola hyperantus]|uniref:alpha-tubulin N-acetyltransferase 1-like n=1 Tax=Aphantopus hyperantus TaxID=2795564 RepID=UPI001568E774|nr:alpha-tubulin N-acetyltransferase 1-like [Maniola hyperantus]
MEFMVPVNDVLTEKITKLNYTLIPPGFHGDVRTARVIQEHLSKLIDRLGEQSAVAQGLNKVITTSERLRNSQDHILYLLKDGNAKGGKGELIGLLKVGWKHLFLFDEKVKVREVEPLCILDFFVLPDRQRHGYGKYLFDYMLNDLEVTPDSLAIDGPSPKMEDFLRKNYGVERLIRQSNNFAISDSFFATAVDNKSGRSTPVVALPVGRFAAPKPMSAIGSVIHGNPENGHGTSGAASPEAHVDAAPVVDDQPDMETGTINQPPLIESEIDTKPGKEELADLQKSPERPSSLKVEPVSETPAPAMSPAGSTSSRRDSQLTERGYFDVKFYHNKLW